MGFESGWYQPPPFRWYVHENARHAIPREPAPGGKCETACGKPLIVKDLEPKLTGHEPECAECDRQWRLKAGLKPRKGLLASAEPLKISVPVTGKGEKK